MKTPNNNQHMSRKKFENLSTMKQNIFTVNRTLFVVSKFGVMLNWEPLICVPFRTTPPNILPLVYPVRSRGHPSREDIAAMLPNKYVAK